MKTDNLKIEIDSVFRYNNKVVEYVSRGSLHDIPKVEILYILEGSYIISFNEDGDLIKKNIYDKDIEDTTSLIVKLANLKNDLRRDFSKKAIQFYPFSLIEPEMGIRTGFEIPITEHISINPGFSALVYYKNILYASSGTAAKIKSYSGFAGYFDFKYFANINKRARFYIGPSLMYKQRYIKAEALNTNGIMAQHSVTSTITTYNFKAGISYHDNKHFLIDGYIGLGLKNKNVVNKTIGFNETSNEDYIGSPITPYPNLLLGFSVGYKL